MNKIFTQLQKIKNEHRIGLMSHLVLGYPTLEDSLALARTIGEVGVDFLELQIPFSDPLADGPTIMRANEAALKDGFKVKDAFTAAQILAKKLIDTPLLFMTYYNLVFHYGVEAFCRDAADAGVSGLIVPDIPLDEEAYDHFFTHAEHYSLLAMRFLSTVSTEERIQKVLDAPDRFLYFIGQKGTTGARAALTDELSNHIRRIRRYQNVSIAVGFGISKPAHIVSLKKMGVDVAVVGSGIMDVYNDAEKGRKIGAVAQYLTTMRAACG
ncbi:MAG: tryptophan synthase subunit alpha [bacterium]